MRWYIQATVFVLAIAFSYLVDPALAASWTQLTNLAPGSASTMLQLTDGTIMVANNNKYWWRLTPDIHGSYVNGIWTASPIQPMSTVREYYTSQVLPDGRVWVLGGEYGGTAAEVSTPEIYDPILNAWSSLLQFPNFPSLVFGDLPSMLLPGGRILAGSYANSTYIYNIAMNTWGFAANKIYDSSAEEGWIKLADGTILTYDVYKSTETGTSYAERYNPTTNLWSSVSPIDGTSNGVLPLLSPLAGQYAAFEIGPLLRLQDGRIIVLGANGHTALYKPTTNTWAPGPDMMGTLAGQPLLYTADDAPGAILPNGHALWAANGNSTLGRYTQIFDFDPVAGTITTVSPACPDPVLVYNGTPDFRMLVLPTGQLLLADGSEQLWIYTPDGPVNPALRPVVNQVVYNGGGLFTLTGIQLNGQGAGATFGDDAQMDENYPIVRMVNSSGNVYYARTTNWSSVGVATGSTPETVNFTLNPALPAGNYSLVVTGAGLSSYPIFVNITQSEVAGQ